MKKWKVVCLPLLVGAVILGNTGCQAAEELFDQAVDVIGDHMFRDSEDENWDDKEWDDEEIDRFSLDGDYSQGTYLTEITRLGDRLYYSYGFYAGSGVFFPDWRDQQHQNGRNDFYDKKE